MPIEITTRTHSTPIKWTEEEWNKIAVQLYQLKGDHALASEDVNDIKARDVFEAQNVLPAERRRKQISIAQGFQQIRARLRGLFERGKQENLFPATAAVQTEASRGGTTPVVTKASTDMPMEESRLSRDVNGDLFAESGLVSNAASDEVASAHLPGESRAQDVQPSQEASVSQPIKAVEQRVEDAPQSRTAAPTAPVGILADVQSSIAVEEHGKQSARRAEHSSASLEELARPFVAMVCDELARALVQAFPGQGLLSSLTSRLQPAVGAVARQFEEPRSQRNAQRPSNNSQPRSADESPMPGQPDVIETGDDDASQPLEVQPLFDPKLPPSANSDFKPMIGLVATRDREYEDLQLLYPQLWFSIVPVEDIHDPDAFRDCQRVIGLREEVPQATEELLKRTLGYRYIWLRGGVDRVREQLDAWLANPSSMQTGPRSAEPRANKGTRKGNGKKQGKWPPRVA